MAKIRCPQCSAEFERHGDFCPSCGYALTFLKEDEPAHEQHSERIPGEAPPPIPSEEPTPAEEIPPAPEKPPALPVTEMPTAPLPVIERPAPPAPPQPPATGFVVVPPPEIPRKKRGLSLAAKIAIGVVAVVIVGGLVWAFTALLGGDNGQTVNNGETTGQVEPGASLALGDRELYLNTEAPFEGTDVEQLQTALAGLGFFTGEISGTFDPATASAVGMFQQAAGFGVNGTVDADVATAVLAAYDRSATLASIDVTSLTPSASSQLEPSGDRTYGASNTLDGDLATAWNEAASGTGEGEWIAFSLSTPAAIGRIDIVNGYTKSDEVFGWNARVRDVTVMTDAGEFTFTLADTQEEQTLLADFGTTSNVTLTIASVYPGNKYEDCAITEVRLWGTP